MVAPGIEYSAATGSGAEEHRSALAAIFEYFRQCPFEHHSLVAAEFPIPGATVITTLMHDGHPLILPKEDILAKEC